MQSKENAIAWNKPYFDNPAKLWQALLTTKVYKCIFIWFIKYSMDLNALQRINLCGIMES